MAAAARARSIRLSRVLASATAPSARSVAPRPGSCGSSTSAGRWTSRSTSPRASSPTAILPGVERAGDRTVRFVADDPETAFRGFLAMLRLTEPFGG
jgi:hypothetical protein